nr:hypothetical protein [Prevotella sp.]
MNKKVNFYFAALLGTMSPLCAVPALASQSLIATATQQQNSCTGNLLAELKNRLKISIFLWRKSCASR